MLQEVWVGVSDEMRLVLDGYTLADLVDRTRIAASSAYAGVAARRRSADARPSGCRSARRDRVGRVDVAGHAARSRRRARPRARSSSSTRPAVGGDELTDDRRARARTRPGRGGPASARQKRSKARARCSSRHPRTRRRAPRASTRRRRRHAPHPDRRTRRARPRARCSGGCRAPARAGPACCAPRSPATSASMRDAALGRRARTRRRDAPLDERRRGRPSTSAARRGVLGAGQEQQAVDEPRQPAHLGERPLEVVGLAVVRPRPRGSRAAGGARPAACGAGATRRRRTSAASARAPRAARRSR